MPGRKQKIENVAASQGNVLGDLVNLDDAKMDEHDVENVGEMMANEKKHEMKKANRPEPYLIGGPLKKGEETPFGNPKLFWKFSRPKYGVTNYQCDKCRNENQMLENRFEIVSTKNGEPRFLHTQSYCLEDVQLNQEMTDLLMKHTEKTRGPMKKNIWG